MTEKVLIHDKAPTEVHIIEGDFLNAAETVCGKRLHPCSTVHIVNDAIPVTCLKCNTWLALNC